MEYVYLKCINNEKHYMIGINGRCDGCMCKICNGKLIPSREATREEYISYMNKQKEKTQQRQLSVKISTNLDEYAKLINNAIEAIETVNSFEVKIELE